MQNNEFKHDKANGAIGPNQDLLDMELKYGRVCIMYHNDTNNNDKWIKYTAQDKIPHTNNTLWETWKRT